MIAANDRSAGMRAARAVLDRQGTEQRMTRQRRREMNLIHSPSGTYFPFSARIERILDAGYDENRFHLPPTDSQYQAVSHLMQLATQGKPVQFQQAMAQFAYETRYDGPK